ncbi:MAG: penicillin-binding transpeptidase domain-containing protein [Planctomycetota bacterium]
MRRRLRQMIPSMFHRRLLLLVLVAIGVLGVLTVQTARLTLASGYDDRRASAQDALFTPQLVPTVRGRIFDRKGRILAEDRPGTEVAVSFEVISGEWAYLQARRAAYVDHRSAWTGMSDAARERLIQSYQGPFDEQVRRLWVTLAEAAEVSPEMLAERRRDIQERVAVLQGFLWQRWRERRSAELGRPVSWDEVTEPIAEQKQAHAVLDQIGPVVVSRLRGFIAEASGDGEAAEALRVWREVVVRPTRQRVYPWSETTVLLETATLPEPLATQFNNEPVAVDVKGVGVHLLGRMRPVYAEDAQRRPYVKEDGTIDLAGYLPGDRVGEFGLERTFEDQLRGVRGRIVRRVDDASVSSNTPTQAGEDLHLTVDISLQARIAAAMSEEIGLMESQGWHAKPGEVENVGERLNGAAVVLEIETGEVLAAVSVPTMPRDLLEREPATLREDPIDLPYLNRVVARPYMPGSTVKPLIVAFAVSSGELGPDEILDCSRGYLWEGSPNVYRDWRVKAGGAPFGPIDAVEALAVSSNTFMGMLAYRLGPERLSDWYARVGLGRRTGSGLPDEISGTIPQPPYRAANRAAVERDNAFIAIGQGPIDWTPLQAVHAYATLARGGVVIPPRFVQADTLTPPDVIERVPLSASALDVALDGMWSSANESQGTTRHLSYLGRAPIWNAEGVIVRAKSGTAQATPLRIDSDGDGRVTRDDPIVKRGNHAWVVALVQPEDSARPTHAIAVVVEYSGSGGQVAGPIVNQVVHAMQAEGYLGGVRGVVGGPR